MTAARDDRAAHAEFLRNAFDDYRKFCGLLQIVTKDRGRQQFVLNPIQRRRIMLRTGLDIVLKARQIGMTTEECARDVWHFLKHPGARVVIVVQSMSTHEPLKAIATIVKGMIDGLMSLGVKLNFAKVTNTEWVLADRDASLRIVEAGATEATAQKKGRGGSITRLHATELAFWEHADSTLLAMLECVPAPETGSEIVFESTPNGAAGPFFQRCQGAQTPDDPYNFLFFPWFDHPDYRVPLAPGESIMPADEREKQLVALGVSREQLKWRRRKIAGYQGKSDVFDQEYPSDSSTCFLIKGRTFFSKDGCIKMLREAPAAPVMTDWRDRLRVWEHPKPGKQYVIGVDTSEGIEEPGISFDRQPHDAAAAIVRERGTGKHVATLWGYLRPDELAVDLNRLGARYNDATVAVERNNHGHAVLLALAALGYRRIFNGEDDRPGWVNSGPRRTTALDAIEAEHRKGPPYYSTPDRALIGQQSTFVISKRGKAEASNGAHDDLVMADMICWDVLNQPLPARGVGQRSLGML